MDPKLMKALEDRLDAIDRRLDALEEGAPEAASMFMLFARSDLRYAMNLINASLKRQPVHSPVERGGTLARIALRETGDLPVGYKRISDGSPVEEVKEPETVFNADPPALSNTDHEIMELVDILSPGKPELDFSKMKES